MARKMTELPSKRGPIAKIMPLDGCKGTQFPWQWNGGTISLNLGVIWEMSVNCLWDDRRFVRHLGNVG